MVLDSLSRSLLFFKTQKGSFKGNGCWKCLWFSLSKPGSMIGQLDNEDDTGGAIAGV